MTPSIKPTFHALSLLLVAFVLAGCAVQQPRSTPGPQPTQSNNPQMAAAQGDYERAANLYMQASTRTSDPAQRQRLRLQAGLAAAQAGNASMAQQILASIQPSTLGDMDRSRYELARREISIDGLTPDQALAQLPPPNSGVPPAIAELVWEKRAQLHFAQNALIAGIGDLVQRGVWLVDETALSANDERIYAKALDSIAYGQGPESRPAGNADDTTRGWLALADIGQRQWASRDQRDQALAAWEQRYPGHPATRSILRDRFDYTPATQPAATGQPGQFPQQGPAPRPSSDTVALALPLTGKFANAAEAIRDGFLFAYGNTRTNAPQPLIYDSNTLTPAAILDQAQRDGVGILVGPLDKPKVAEIGRLPSDIPEVALNYTDTQNNRPGFYQFALAPEDEAAAVARHASERGYARALALVPKGDWGSRVFDAFRSRFNADGGQVVNYATYDAGDRDYRGPIQSVLSGYQQGQGADFIFVAARPLQARLIRSQLRFYRASNLPMLSTSHAYTGTVNAGDDIDLNGVGFADMPWVVGSGDFLETRRNEARQQYGDVAEHYSRLFAMGMDAWKLTDNIAKEGLSSGDVFEGMTGVLALQPDGRVTRYLAWAVFRSGRPQLVQMPSESDARIDSTQSVPWEQR
ncbi:penicillin-binding protein activator [Salinisphaera aquimarina]|uniref:Penicillin-binding protein activator n=1 Tax=Salinisphaera aquimarina TaxID=2094031 RepID=A0ABV7EKJ4_9GAMM